MSYQKLDPPLDESKSRPSGGLSLVKEEARQLLEQKIL